MPKSDTQFKKGQSGNPGGRPKTKPFRDALLVRIRESDDPEVLSSVADALLEGARSGDTQSIAILADRLEGKPSHSLEMNLEVPLSAMTPAEAFGVVTDAVSNGEINPQQGQQLASLIEAKIKVVEIVEMEERLTKLERNK